MQLTEPEISVKVFISYAHADQELRKKLEDHLSSLQYLGKITIWQDQEIPAGANWEDQINTHLNEADMILLLVSSSFIASKYCWNKEVWAALERHKAGTARVIPIILRSVLWQDTPLGQLQVLPTTAKPVTLWDDQDAAFEDVVRGIRGVVENLLITLRKETQSVEKINRLENRKEEPEVELEVTQLVQLITAPVIAAQRGWKAWEATFSDISVRYVRTSPSADYVYVATGTNKKESDAFWYTSPRNIGYLCKVLVELYSRQEAVDSSEWVVKEIFPFLN